MTTIKLSGYGPLIDELQVPVLAAGGVVVLTGKCGVGKSIALEALESLATGKTRPPVSDGASEGTVEGLGVSVRTGKRFTRTGDLEADYLESRFSLSALVDPGLQDPERADAARIRALVSLLAPDANGKIFHDLLGGAAAYEEVASADTQRANDVLEMASKLKRDIEAAARKQEALAENAQRRADELNGLSEGVDFLAESDPEKLHGCYETAVHRCTAFVAGRDKYIEAQKNAKQAQVRLQAARAHLFEMGDSEQIEAQHADSVTALEAMDATIETLREQLRLAESSRRELAAKSEALSQKALRSGELRETISNAAATIEKADKVPPVTDETISAAEASVEASRRAIERGHDVRRAKAAEEDRKGEIKKQNECLLQAESLREAARMIDSVLATLLAGTGVEIIIRDGRIYLDTDRGQELLSDLSDGERWEFAIRIGTRLTDEGGIVVVPQDAWQHLDFEFRQRVVASVRKKRITLYTAEVSTGMDACPELRAEEFGIPQP